MDQKSPQCVSPDNIIPALPTLLKTSVILALIPGNASCLLNPKSSHLASSPDPLLCSLENTPFAPSTSSRYGGWCRAVTVLDLIEKHCSKESGQQKSKQNDFSRR